MSEPSTEQPGSSHADTIAAAKSQSDTKPATFRLVIRAEIIPEGDPRISGRRHSIRQYLNRRVLLLGLGVVAVLTLSWVGIRALRTDSTAAPVASEGARDVLSTEPLDRRAESQSPAPIPAPRETATVSVESSSTEAKSAESEVREEPDASPAPINEVIPDVPLTARQTIRGTVRVLVRVIIDKEGAVLAATPDDPGPSRYFERLAIEASKEWTFAPVETEEQRVMAVQFNFTREGTTARANPLQ
jgi:TonB family protein